MVYQRACRHDLSDRYRRWVSNFGKDLEEDPDGGNNVQSLLEKSALATSMQFSYFRIH
jgi:hypothetical protein